MSEIYANAVLAISTASSRNPLDGFLFPDSLNVSKGTRFEGRFGGPTTQVYTAKSIDHRIMTFCRYMTDHEWREIINTRMRLLSRGWAFQERNLATRIVHFTESELVWECRERSWCECGGIPPKMNNMQSAIQYALENSDASNVRRIMWREIVQSYTRHRLSVSGDRLPALAGMATSFAKASGDEYLAGLWRAALPYDLLWQCDQTTGLNESKERRPSWSWASVDCGINWPDAAIKGPSPILGFSPRTSLFEKDTSAVEVLEVACEPEGESPCGRVISGKIVLRSALLPVVLRTREGVLLDIPPWDGFREKRIFIDGLVADFWPDVKLFDVDWERPAWYVDIMVEDSQVYRHGLVVRLVQDFAGQLVYERIGVARIYMKGTSPELHGLHDLEDIALV